MATKANLTEQQKRWAASHDWYVGPFGNTIEVLDRYTDANGQYHEDKYPWTGSFQALRDWAGY